MEEASARRYRGLSAMDRALDRRARIREAALELFAEKGAANVGVKEVCSAAGLTDRYLYESYANLDELFFDVTDLAAQTVYDAVAAAAATTTEPQKLARAVVGAFVDVLKADQRIANVLFLDPGPKSTVNVRCKRIRGNLRRFAELMVRVAAPGTTQASEAALAFWGVSTVGAIHFTIAEWLEGQLVIETDELIARLAQQMLDGAARAAAPEGSAR